jgi:hypothetical protein
MLYDGKTVLVHDQKLVEPFDPPSKTSHGQVSLFPCLRHSC